MSGRDESGNAAGLAPARPPTSPPDLVRRPQAACAAAVDAHAQPTLRGPRVVLRPILDADRPRIEEILDEPEVARWWLRDEWERVMEVGSYTFAVELPDEAAGRSSRVVGMIQYSEELDPGYKRAAIDIFLSDTVQSRGVGAEAIRTLIRYLIDERGHRRFIIDPAADNERAIRCYTKVGFRPVGIMRRYERFASGDYRDGLLMDLLAEELTEDPPADR